MCMSPDRGCDPQDRGLMVGRGTGKTGDPKLCPPASRWWWPRCPCTGSCRSPSSTPGPQICSWKAQDDTHTHKTPRPQPQGWRTPSDRSLHQGGTWKRPTIENISNHLDLPCKQHCHLAQLSGSWNTGGQTSVATSAASTNRHMGRCQLVVGAVRGPGNLQHLEKERCGH